MAARTSYTVVGTDQKPLTYGRMVELHDEMAVADPKHMSPFEHCGQAMNRKEYMHSMSGIFTVDSRYIEYSGQDGGRTETKIEGSKGWSGNFRGFKQYRKMIPNENVT
jgi:hypothetical protein